MGDPLQNDIKNLVELSFVFVVKVTYYNLKVGSQLYTVERVYPSDNPLCTAKQLDHITNDRALKKVKIE